MKNNYPQLLAAISTATSLTIASLQADQILENYDVNLGADPLGPSGYQDNTTRFWVDIAAGTTNTEGDFDTSDADEELRVADVDGGFNFVFRYVLPAGGNTATFVEDVTANPTLQFSYVNETTENTGIQLVLKRPDFSTLVIEAFTAPGSASGTFSVRLADDAQWQAAIAEWTADTGTTGYEIRMVQDATNAHSILYDDFTLISDPTSITLEDYEINSDSDDPVYDAANRAGYQTASTVAFQRNAAWPTGGGYTEGDVRGFDGDDELLITHTGGFKIPLRRPVIGGIGVDDFVDDVQNYPFIEFECTNESSENGVDIALAIDFVAIEASRINLEPGESASFFYNLRDDAQWVDLITNGAGTEKLGIVVQTAGSPAPSAAVTIDHIRLSANPTPLSTEGGNLGYPQITSDINGNIILTLALEATEDLNQGFNGITLQPSDVSVVDGAIEILFDVGGANRSFLRLQGNE